MPCLWYYSSAKPDSGYTGAVRGYAQKLAKALGFEAIQLESDAPDHLQQLSMRTDTPAIVIGVQSPMSWPGAQPPFKLKSRPYADQHGLGPSMHGLTAVALKEALLPEAPAKPLATLCMANPVWLAGQMEDWAARISQWVSAQSVQALCLTNSPRTNPILWQEWLAVLSPLLSVQLIVNDIHQPPNRYAAMLAAADSVLILGSSRSMAGEAAMTGAPVTYLADDKESEARFFADAADLMGVHADRYSRFDAARPAPHHRFTPFDVTDIYVQQAISQFRAVRAA